MVSKLRSERAKGNMETLANIIGCAFRKCECDKCSKRKKTKKKKKKNIMKDV